MASGGVASGKAKDGASGGVAGIMRIADKTKEVVGVAYFQQLRWEVLMISGKVESTGGISGEFDTRKSEGGTLFESQESDWCWNRRR